MSFPLVLTRPSIRAEYRSPRLAILAGIALFWMLLGAAGLVQPNYDAARDSVSSLAAHGASHAWLGFSAIAVGGLGLIGLSLLTRRISEPAALTLGLAGVALLIVAVTRINCPVGAAHCAMSDATPALTGLWHKLSTALYEFFFMAAMACVAMCCWRARVRTHAALMILGIVASILLFAVLPIEFGLRQRANLLVHTLLIAGLLVAALPALHGDATSAPRQSG